MRRVTNLKQQIMRKLSCLIVMLVFVTNAAFSGGYQVRLQGQEQTTIGLIGTPLVFGSSGIFYNPGTLTFMENEYDFEAGVSFIISTAVFQKANTDYQAETNNPVKPPPYFYGAKKINEKLAVGFGFYTPFGSTSKWDNDWAGKLLVQDVSFKSFFFQPTVSYKIRDDIGIGVGLIYAVGNVDLQRGLHYDDDAFVTLEGSTHGWGFNIGMFWNINEKWTFGVDFRSKIQMDVEGGDARFNLPLSIQTTVAPTNKFNAGLPMPANLDFGFAYKANEKLTLAVEANYVFWSTYEDLSFTFEENGELLNSVNPREYKNSFITRIGGEYIYDEKWTFRAGMYYDPSPAHDDYFTPETVTLNTFAFTFGATYTYNENWLITFSYLQTNGAEMERSYTPANFSGKYKTIANIPGIGIRYRF